MPQVPSEHAKNTSPEPLVKVKAYVTPQLSGKDLPMAFYDPRQPISTKTTIFPGEELNLYYIVPSTDKNQQSVSLQEYLQTYGGITIRLESDGKTVFTHIFPFSP